MFKFYAASFAVILLDKRYLCVLHDRDHLSSPLDPIIGGGYLCYSVKLYSVVATAV